VKTMTLLVLLLAIGCHAPSQEPVTPTAASWVLVSRPCAELDGLDRAGVARVASSSSIFVLEPVFDRSVLVLDTVCHHKMSVRSAPAERLQVGQIAAVEVSIDAAANEEHVLRVRPTRKGIVIITPTTLTVPSKQAFWIRFTGATTGEGGVAIEVLECRLAGK